VLKSFLESKPLYYDEIDYARMPKVYEKIKHHFTSSKIIHIIGTNAKGTTGRFLATALFHNGYRVGHFTSPHILLFNERVWFNGSDVDDATLDNAHLQLSNILTKTDLDSLSYFEYTTLIAMWIYQDADYVVLEAGLGGEFDATAVFDKVLTLVTPIDIDHEAFLGNNIKDIAKTKLRAIQNSAILANQKYLQVYDIANILALENHLKIYRLNEFLDDLDYINIEKISKHLKLVKYLKDNLSLAISALKFLGVKYLAKDFEGARLFGRLTPVDDNILVDVGHNTLAAKSILEALKGRKYILIYNSYKDKNYKKILYILKPIILYVEIIDVDEQRIEAKEILEETLEDLSIEYKTFHTIKKENQYLVFGSFSVVESFLKWKYN